MELGTTGNVEGLAGEIAAQPSARDDRDRARCHDARLDLTSDHQLLAVQFGAGDLGALHHLNAAADPGVPLQTALNQQGARRLDRPPQASASRDQGDGLTGLSIATETQTSRQGGEWDEGPGKERHRRFRNGERDGFRKGKRMTARPAVPDQWTSP